MTLATSYSIKQKGKIDIDDIYTCFKSWANESKFTATGKVFDIGKTTLRAIMWGYGLNGEYSNGNGSLMRIIPLAFFHDVTAEQIWKVSAITHAHENSCNACVLYV